MNLTFPKLDLPHDLIQKLYDAYTKDKNANFVCNFIKDNKHGMHLTHTMEIHEALRETFGVASSPLESVVDELNNLTMPQRDELYRMGRQLRLDWLNHELKRTASCS